MSDNKLTEEEIRRIIDAIREAAEELNIQHAFIIRPDDEVETIVDDRDEDEIH